MKNLIGLLPNKQSYGPSEILGSFLKIDEFVALSICCVQLASYLEGGPLMCMMHLHLRVNQKHDDDDVTEWVCV